MYVYALNALGLPTKEEKYPFKPLGKHTYNSVANTVEEGV